MRVALSPALDRPGRRRWRALDCIELEPGRSASILCSLTRVLQGGGGGGGANICCRSAHTLRPSACSMDRGPRSPFARTPTLCMHGQATAAAPSTHGLPADQLPPRSPKGHIHTHNRSHHILTWSGPFTPRPTAIVSIDHRSSHAVLPCALLASIACARTGLEKSVTQALPGISVVGCVLCAVYVCALCSTRV